MNTTLHKFKSITFLELYNMGIKNLAGINNTYTCEEHNFPQPDKNNYPKFHINIYLYKN